MEKKFILFFAIISFAILLSIGLFNFIIDVDKKFYKKKYFLSNVQQNFYNKETIYLAKDVDYRLIKRYLFNEYNDNLDILLCGGSTTLNINSNFFKNKKFLNISVPALNINDLNTLCLDAFNRLKPKIIIIEVSHSLFDNYSSARFNLRINKNKDLSLKFLNHDFFSLIEYSYTKKNLLFLIKNLNHKNIDSSDKYVELYYDGSSDYLKNVKFDHDLDSKKVLLQAKSEDNLLLKMDENIYKQLYNLLEYFRKTSQIYILKTPLTSIFDNISYQTNNNYLIIENALNNLAKEDIVILGSFHNNNAGCVDKDHIIPNHPNINCLKKSFSNF
jgi:hypothetical protein